MTDYVGAYCRGVEAALARVSDGPLARLHGVNFAAVQGWHDSGIPLSIVERAIEETAERQRGRGQPVRIRVEFLDRDVRRMADEHRRRIGPQRRGERPEHPVEPLEGSEDGKRRARMATLSLAIERHGDRASAADLEAWRAELADLEAQETR